MKDLQLINTLCESRVFRTKQAIARYSDSDKKELFYSILLSTIALSQDTHTSTWAEKYASSAAAFGNFDYFRTSGTDLYVLTHILQVDLGLIAKSQAQVLVRLYRSLGRGKFDRSLVEQSLLRMERSLGISNTQLRNARRTIVNWVRSTPTERKQAVTRLHRFIRTKAKLAEVLPYLLALTKGDKGHFGKMSPLKKAAAIAGAGLAGLVIGYKTHDQNRRWNIRDSIDIADTQLTEDRPTQLFQLVHDMRKHPEIEKIIGIHYLSDGISAFVRTTDGNAYEMEIRPARYAKGHQGYRGIAEGWEWHSLDEKLVGLEDGETQDCWRCKGSGRSYDDPCLHCMGSGRLDSDGHAVEDIDEANDEDNPECEDCYDTGWATEQSWEDKVNVPCTCKNALEFRNKFVQEDVWKWIPTDVLNEDIDDKVAKQEFVDNLKGDQLCPTCEEPMDSVQLYHGSKHSYICMNCL